MHVHVHTAGGEAKFWLEPKIALARNYRLSKQQLGEIENIIEDHYAELTAAWREHFPSR